MSTKSKTPKKVEFMRMKKVKFLDLLKEVLDEEEGADSCMQVLGNVSSYEYDAHAEYVMINCVGLNGSRMDFKFYYSDLCKYFYYKEWMLVKDNEFEYIVFVNPYNG